MTLERFSPLLWLAGVAALGFALFLLQRLRPRRREVVVPALLLWRLAVAEAPARHLRKRFQNLPAYLLALLIASLLWTVAAKPQFAHTPGRAREVIVIDGSAAMAAGNRLDEAKREAVELARKLPSENREVLWCGERLEVMLKRGTEAQVLQARLRNQQAAPSPQQLLHALRLIALEARPDAPLHITLITASPPVLPTLPHVEVSTRAVGPASIRNAGVVAFGFDDDEIDGLNAIDVYLETAATPHSRPAPIPKVTIDGNPLPAAQIETLWTNARGSAFLLRGMPAKGALLKAALDERDDLTFDDAAALRLPQPRTVRVLVSPTLKELLLPVLLADTGFEPVEQGAEVVLRKAGEALGGSLPAVEFEEPDDVSHISINHPRDADPRALKRALSSVVDTIDPRVPAYDRHDSKEYTSLEIQPAEHWNIRLSGDFLAKDAAASHRRALPLLIGQSLRWIAKDLRLPAQGTAGRPWTQPAFAGQPLVFSPTGEPVRMAGGTYAPAAAGELKMLNGESLPIALLDRDSTVAQRTEREPAGSILPPAPTELTILTLIAALLLLTFEWWRFSRGQMP